MGLFAASFNAFCYTQTFCYDSTWQGMSDVATAFNFPFLFNKMIYETLIFSSLYGLYADDNKTKLILGQLITFT